MPNLWGEKWTWCDNSLHLQKDLILTRVVLHDAMFPSSKTEKRFQIVSCILPSSLDNAVSHYRPISASRAILHTPVDHTRHDKLGVFRFLMISHLRNDHWWRKQGIRYCRWSLFGPSVKSGYFHHPADFENGPLVEEMVSELSPEVLKIILLKGHTSGIFR